LVRYRCSEIVAVGKNPVKNQLFTPEERVEMIKELATENNIQVDEKAFHAEFDKHQELSRTASAGKFKSGLADHSEQTTKLHTACHLLNQALREVLNDKNINM